MESLENRVGRPTFATPIESSFSEWIWEFPAIVGNAITKKM